MTCTISIKPMLQEFVVNAWLNGTHKVSAGDPFGKIIKPLHLKIVEIMMRQILFLLLDNARHSPHTRQPQPRLYNDYKGIRRHAACQ